MRKVLYILIFLPFLFMGSAGKLTPQNKDRQEPTTLIDTFYLKVRAQQMADSAAHAAVKKIDTLLGKETRFIGGVDIEYRPVGKRIYRFDWIRVYKAFLGDTTYDTTYIKRVDE